MKMTMADERSHKPPPRPITPYSAGVPLPKNFAKPINIPNKPPRKKSQVRMLRMVLSIIIPFSF